MHPPPPSPATTAPAPAFVHPKMQRLVSSPLLSGLRGGATLGRAAQDRYRLEPFSSPRPGTAGWSPVSSLLRSPCRTAASNLPPPPRRRRPKPWLPPLLHPWLWPWRACTRCSRHLFLPISSPRVKEGGAHAMGREAAESSQPSDPKTFKYEDFMHQKEYHPNVSSVGTAREGAGPCQIMQNQPSEFIAFSPQCYLLCFGNRCRLCWATSSLHITSFRALGRQSLIF
ncbi:hypothetical protein ACQJBY_000356 [Aegilops geniculata]